MLYQIWAGKDYGGKQRDPKADSKIESIIKAAIKQADRLV
jgi:hypothetical protein